MSAGRIMKGIAIFLLKLLLAAVIVIGLYRFGGYAYDFGYQLYAGKGAEEAPGRDMAVVVAQGQSVSSVAEMLQRLGLVKDKWVYIVQERLSKYHGGMQAGDYVLNTSQSGEDMIAILSGHREDIESGEQAQNDS